MTVRPSTDDVVRRGEELFQSRIRPAVEHNDPRDFVAIDIVSGDYAANGDDGAAEDAVFARHPDAVLFVRRVGDIAAHFVGRV